MCLEKPNLDIILNGLFQIWIHELKAIDAQPRLLKPLPFFSCNTRQKQLDMFDVRPPKCTFLFPKISTGPAHAATQIDAPQCLKICTHIGSIQHPQHDGPRIYLPLTRAILAFMAYWRLKDKAAGSELSRVPRWTKLLMPPN